MMSGTQGTLGARWGRVDIKERQTKYNTVDDLEPRA
jgi:hypothetical protein